MKTLDCNTRMAKLLSIAGAFLFSLPTFASDQPLAFADTWESFRAAVMTNRIDDAVALTRFPLRSIDSGHPNIPSTTAFRERFNAIFEPILIEMMKSGACETGKGDPGYEANCGNGYMIFGFEERENRYSLSYFGSINE